MPGKASRENGKKGGRPRKHPRANPPETPAKPLGKWALTRREELFVHQIVTFPEKTQGECYRDAGFRVKTADTASTNAARLLGKDRVARALAAARQALAERHQITQDRVLKELGRIGFADLRKLFEERQGRGEMTAEQMYASANADSATKAPTFAELPAAVQAAWKAAAAIAGSKVSGGYFLKSPDQLDDDTAACLAGIEVVTKNIGDGEVEYVHKVKTVDKLGALTTIAKHLGMLKDKGETPNVVPLFALPADARPDVSGAGT